MKTMKSILVSILLTIGSISSDAQNMISCVDGLDFCHMYCEMNDGRYGTVGIVETDNVKEIDGRDYIEINVGPLKEEGSIRLYKREGGAPIMYSMETLLKEGIFKYYREDEKKVYAYSEEKREEELVLDFSLNVGDTFVRANGEKMKVVEVADTTLFVYTEWETGKKIVLRSEDDSAEKDIWVEGIGSLNTGILSCDVLNGVRMAKLVGCSASTNGIEGLVYDMKFSPFTEEKFKTGWLTFLESDESQSPKVNYEFVNDTLHLYGYMEQECVGSVPLQCMVRGNKIEICEILFPGQLGTTCTSIYKVNAKFSGFDDGVYQVSYNGSEPVEVVCGEVNGVKNPFVQEGKQWNYKSSYSGTAPEYEQSWEYSYYLQGDTIIGGNSCLNLYYEGGQNKVKELYCGAMYEKEGKIFFIPDGQTASVLLYDFSCLAGDKLNTYCGLIEVEGISELLYHAKSHIVITVQDEGLWIEGVGSIYDLFTLTLSDPGEERWLVSCELNGELIFDGHDFHLSNETVDIHDCQTEIEVQDNVFYDLTGHPISHPSKGIYIQNGKKVWVNE